MKNFASHERQRAFVVPDSVEFRRATSVSHSSSTPQDVANGLMAILRLFLKCVASPVRRCSSVPPAGEPSRGESSIVRERESERFAFVCLCPDDFVRRRCFATKECVLDCFVVRETDVDFDSKNEEEKLTFKFVRMFKNNTSRPSCRAKKQ